MGRLRSCRPISYISCYNQNVLKSEKLSIMITFGVGFAGGFYLYLTDFAARIVEFTTPDYGTVSEFTIVGEVYGGCRSACPSFQLLSDGSYRYLYTPSVGAEQVIRRGTVPLSVQQQLQQSVVVSELREQSKTIRPASCRSFTDGVDVSYDITVEGASYQLDSCGTAVDGDSKLWLALGAVWSYFQAPEDGR